MSHLSLHLHPQPLLTAELIGPTVRLIHPTSTASKTENQSGWLGSAESASDGLVSDHVLHSSPSFSYLLPHPSASQLQSISLILLLAVLAVLSIQHSDHHHRHSLNAKSRCRKKNRVKIFSADYVPHPSVVNAVYKPLPTRRHFRISHVGNQNGSDSETESEWSDRPDSSQEFSSSAERSYNLVFGKRLRGEEDEFKGRSALKGARTRSTQLSQSSGLSDCSDLNHHYLRYTNRLVARFDLNRLSS